MISCRRRFATVVPSRALGTALLLALTAALPAAGQTDSRLQAVDAVFARWDSTTTPGCAVGVSAGGETVLERAYGMAELEQEIPNTPITIFENGSVSKQFTAAAVVLLAMDGALSLEDDIRDYVPEVPDYGPVITLRHLLTHTSGLRDWGSVAGISGWGRSQRTHTHAHVLDILSRQTALNFEPGHEYSYSNSGYNLLAVVVTRVSGVPFAEFSRERIFEPLGMTRTQWRDDYRRIVPGRSAAYQLSDEVYVIDRPIENVHGNGGLLTTVGDLLTWTRALQEGTLAGPEFTGLMQEQGRLNDGRTIFYANGLMIREVLGQPAVTHSGATSGYRAQLGRFPQQDLAVAVLCNVGAANAGRYWTDVARIYLGEEAEDASEPQLPEPVAVPRETLESRAGLYRIVQTGLPGVLTLGADGILRQGRTVLVPVSGDEFMIGATGQRIVFGDPGPSGRAPFRLLEGDVVVDEFEPVEPVDPSPEELRVYQGTFHSPDAETTYRVAEEDGELVIYRRPDARFTLRPVYLDAFRMGGRLIRFHRDGAGRVAELSLTESRVYDMRFFRIEEGGGNGGR